MGVAPPTSFFLARRRRAGKGEKGFFREHLRSPGRRAAALLHHPLEPLKRSCVIDRDPQE